MLIRRLVLSLLVIVSAVLAQTERGSIAGTVQDSTGAVIPGAKISVTNTATNVTTPVTSAATGDFTAVSLSPGTYTITVDKEGFKHYVRSGVILPPASNIRVDVSLEVGTAQQSVEVSADVQLLQTENAKSSVTVNMQLVDKLPLVVGGALRSVFDLASGTPEAKNLGDRNFIVGGGQGASFGATLDGVSTNTTRALETSWVSVNTPSLEAISEFTVDSNGFKAEYGHSGGGVMTFSSKSGTNSFHGSAYEFLRNNALDARRFFEAQAGIYKQHDFGASFGGPVWIPKIYKGKDKTFFFVAYEGFRNRVGATTRSMSVPTPEMYDGDFSKWVNASGVQIPVYDPFSLRTESGRQVRTQFAGNVIPKNRFDPLSVKALAVFQESGVLKPNNGAAPGTSAYVRSNYFITQGSVLNPVDKFSVKGDHSFSEKNRLSGYFGRNRSGSTVGPNGPPELPGNYVNFNDYQLKRDSEVYRLSWDHIFRPNLLNHFYAGGNNWRENHDPYQAVIGTHWKDKFCLPGVPDCDQNLVRLQFGDFATWGSDANNGSENTIFSFNNDLTWIRGKHVFKMGAQYQRGHYNGFGRQSIAGRADFTNAGTSVPGDTSLTTGGGNGFASFLLGWADNGQIDTIRFISQQWPYYAGYFQDDWRVNNKLTLNLGVRWETTLPPVEANDRWSDFSPTRPNPKADNIPGALIYAGSGAGREGTRSLADSYFKAFGPHIGMAWSMNDKTVVRGSFAVSYAAITTISGSTHQRGFTQTVGFPNNTSGVQPAFLFKDGVPAYPIPPFIDPSFANRDSPPWWQGTEATRPPANTTWNLSIQRQVTKTILLETAYNANIGSRLQANLLRYNQLNPLLLQTLGPALLNSDITSPAAVAAGIRAPFAGFKTLWGGSASVAQALRPFPQYGNIDTQSGGGDHSGHSSYHAALVRLEQRFSGGLTFQGSYVFSKLLTDSDSFWSTDFQGASDHFNRSLEKSIGAYDVTHNVKFGFVYDLPFGRGRKYLSHGLASTLIGGWRLSALTAYSSGLPVGLTSGVNLPIFAGRQAATITTYDGWRGAQARDKFDPQTDRFFQPASFFGPQPNNRIGNSTRFNPKVRQFPNYNENISVAKEFAITEKMHLDFRWEAFNLFNRVRFGIGPRRSGTDPGTASLTDPNFGRITSNGDLLNDPRRMQFALKLYF